MNEYTTTDVRDLDCVPLARIGGCQYYETRSIVKDDGQTREIVGRASDWPLIKLTAENAELRAQNTELTHLLVASEERSIDADCQVVELITQRSIFQEHIAALEQALAETQPAQITPPEAESAEAAFAEATAPMDAPTPAETAASAMVSPDTRRKCPYCNERPKLIGMQAHMERKHPDRVEVAIVAAPTPPLALALGEAPWHCAQCQTNTHARSLERPAFCIRCVVSATDAQLSNGHQVAA